MKGNTYFFNSLLKSYTLILNSRSFSIFNTKLLIQPLSQYQKTFKGNKVIFTYRKMSACILHPHFSTVDIILEIQYLQKVMRNTLAKKKNTLKRIKSWRYDSCRPKDLALMTNLKSCLCRITLYRITLCLSGAQKSRDYIKIIPGLIFFGNCVYLEKVNCVTLSICLLNNWLQFCPKHRSVVETMHNNSPVGSSALL